MAIISAQNLVHSFSGPLILDQVNVQIHVGQRICLLGRNGEGKSTFMRILAHELAADRGQVQRAKGMTMALLPQEIPADVHGTVYDVVAAGTEHGRELSLDFYKHASGHDQALWAVHNSIETILTQLQLDPQDYFEHLSGGQQRKALLARALVTKADLLFLDEPTNHLDIQTIQWLEAYLLQEVRTLFFVTHDRMFLRQVANRILELDRGQIVDWACDYDTFLERKEEVLAAEEAHWQRLDQKLKEEEIWIRQGIRARRTRNEGRVRALQALRQERQLRREREGSVSMKAHMGQDSGRLVLEAKNVSYAWQKNPILVNFSVNIMRGHKVGIIGPNGVGKSTLLGLLLGHLQPDQGVVRLGTKVDIAYFDQQRTALDPEATARELVAHGSDYLDINGRRRHVLGYLRDFLFTAHRAQIPVSLLSGGERHRLLLARIFAQPSNVLVLDEPTNDLDQETLELLEELVAEYTGTVLVVSHDRQFLNNIATSCLVFEGQGRVVEYAGGYDDWLSQRPEPPQVVPKVSTKPRRIKTQVKKLTFKQARELEGLPGQIETVEEELAVVHQCFHDPDFYTQDHLVVTAQVQRMKDLEEQLDSLLTRWHELEELRALYQS